MSDVPNGGSSPVTEGFEQLLWDVEVELSNALTRFASFNSGHEGWAVIREEVDELWEEVKANRSSSAEARTEAIQIAAMALRYVLDVTGRA